MVSFNDMKKWVVLQLIISYTFLVSGLIVNFLELCTLIFIWPFNRHLYKRINYYLALLMWGNLSAMAQYWSGSDFEFFSSDETIKHIGKENAISALNHKYEIDWLFGWVLCQRVDLLGCCKVINKSATKYLPIVGWSFWFKEMLFLKRDWASDQKTLIEGVNAIVDKPSSMVYNLSIFCEGTRFTKEKHEASMKVAREKGYPELKHHLLPRTKGFNLLVNTIHKDVDWLYDITIGIPKVNGEKPSLKLIKDGIPIKFQIYLRRIPMSSVPINDEKACSEWIHKLYQEKDAIFDVFDKTGSFGETEEIKKQYLKRNGYDLYVACFWLLTIAVPSVFYLLAFFINGAWISKLILIMFFIIINLAVKYLISSTDTTKASDFGLQSPEKKKN